jgi:hypothetical protein
LPFRRAAADSAADVIEAELLNEHHQVAPYSHFGAPGAPIPECGGRTGSNQ